MRILVALALLFAPLAASGQDAAPGDYPFKEGDRIRMEDAGKLEPYLPPEFWENREYFFFEGMEIEVGPIKADYHVAPEWYDKGKQFYDQVSIGKDEALVGYRSGYPFDPEKIDCANDPQAGLKIMWNHNKRWQGAGVGFSFSYTYWDRGEQLPLYYEGSIKEVKMAYNFEQEYDETSGDLFDKDKRQIVWGLEVDAPADVRGVIGLRYQYKSEDGPFDEQRDYDFWVYVPDLRRVRRISAAQRTDSVQGTDFTMDDSSTFAGLVNHYDWKCHGVKEIIAAMNTRYLAYPYNDGDDYNFGPFGFAMSNDRWELREAYHLTMDPKDEDHPYERKEIYLDKQFYKAHYSFAYDRKDELWKILTHNYRWTEDPIWKGKPDDPYGKGPGGVWYPAWEGVEAPRDMTQVGMIVVNVQTGTGNVIEIWDAEAVPMKGRGKIRRYIDLGRLNKGR